MGPGKPFTQISVDSGAWDLKRQKFQSIPKEAERKLHRRICMTDGLEVRIRFINETEVTIWVLRKVTEGTKIRDQTMRMLNCCC